MTTSDASPAPYEPDAAHTVALDEDDWDDAPIAPRPRLPWPTKALVVAAIGAAAFAGGVFAQKHWGASSSASGGGAAAGATSAFRRGSSASGGQGGSRAGSFFGRGAGGQGGGRLGTIGQVAYIRGATLYVTDSSGNVIKVQVPKGARVSKTVATTLQTIRPGDTVVVRGQSSGGTVRATGISVGTPGGAPGG